MAHWPIVIIGGTTGPQHGHIQPSAGKGTIPHFNHKFTGCRGDGCVRTQSACGGPNPLLIDLHAIGFKARRLMPHVPAQAEAVSWDRLFPDGH